MASSQFRLTHRPLMDGSLIHRSLPALLGCVGALLAVLALEAPLVRPVGAQVESYLLGPGSSVGPETKVEPKNCVTAPDGSITCDTQLKNSPSDTPAKPQYSPWRN